MNSGYVHVGDCVYLPGRRWALRMLPAPRSDQAYRDLLEESHRRSGWIVYRPVCRGCQACRPIRVPVARFAPTRSQRRCLRRNEDVTLEVGPCEPDEEKRLLHNRFIEARFDKGESGFASLSSYAEVFGPSPVTTVEMRYRVQGRLVGLGIVDLLPEVVSSVYFFFDPAEARRSLGTYSVLREIELARSSGRPWVYLGYFVSGCREMTYKARFRPCELMDEDGVWREAPPEPPATPEPAAE